jgi:hypothetical protein
MSGVSNFEFFRRLYVYGINLISSRNNSGDEIFYLYNAH